MIMVVLDANVIHRDPWLTSETGQKLVALADAGLCNVVYPQVVIKELTRQRQEAAEQAFELVEKGLLSIDKAGVDTSRERDDVRVLHKRIGLDLEAAFQQVLSRKNIATAAVPKVMAEELLARDLERRRPFLEIEQGQKKKSVGFRDVLIWETTLELLRTESSTQLTIFVSSDKGFLSEDLKGLHPDLNRDLVERSIEPSCVMTAKNLAQAIATIEAETAKQEREFPEESIAPDKGLTEAVVAELKGVPTPRLELVAAATDALYDLLGNDVSMQTVYGGDYDYPDFVKFTVPGLEHGVITDIDQISEFVFKESELSADVQIATADAVITIEGTISALDWFGSEPHSIHVAGRPNDHYLEGSAEVDVRVVVELEDEAGQVTAVQIVLEDSGSRLDKSQPELDIFVS